MEKLQCARCLRRQGDVDRAHFFLCPACRHRHQQDAFRDSPPIYSADAGRGRCEYCDEEQAIEHHEWLLCGYCTRVVQSYRMGRLSASFVLDALRTEVEPAVQQLKFEEADPVLVQATGRRGRRRELATRLDLQAVRRDDGAPCFWIEIKTGPGSIDEIPEFQLDCSDCDDIMNAVRVSGLPAFLVHCQMGKIPQPPTMRLVGHGVWWTTLPAFAEAFKDVRPRRGNERKHAAYFQTTCFSTLATFGQFLSDGGLDEQRAILAASGCPVLYRG